MPEFVVVVQAISDNELVRNLEAKKIRLQINAGSLGLPQQHGGLHTGWSKLLHRVQQAHHRFSGIEDIIQNYDMSSGQIRYQ